MNYFISGDLIYYKTDFLLNDISTYEKGETVGVTVGALYDLVITSQFGFGMGVSVTFANISEIESDGVVFPANFWVSRIDLSLGIRLYK